MIKKIVLCVLCTVLFFSCQTVDLEPEIQTEESAMLEDEKLLQKEDEALLVEELLKVNEIEPTVVVVEKPIYYPVEKETPSVNQGKDSVVKHLEGVTKLPQYENGRLRSYSYHPDYVYEIHCQTYHTTDIQLEPGEKVLEVPYISEPDVWQIASGVSIVDGQAMQHFFIKPDFTKLISNLIIVTDRRVYHIELKSFSDYYMPIVRWTYPLDSIKKFSPSQNTIVNKYLDTSISTIRPEFLSFDYKMTHPMFNKPSWLPKQVYDDGSKTYIVLDEKSLHTDLPVLFNERNELVNYRIQKNLFIIDQLITKVTLRLGNVKVTIEKKRTNEVVTSNSTTETSEGN